MEEEQAEHQEKESEVSAEDSPAEETDESEKIADDEDEDEEELSAEEDIPEEDDDLLEEEPPGRGCLLGCVTPIVVIFVIALVIGMIGYSRRDALRQGLLKRIVANTHDQVLNDLPADLDENQIEADFDKLKLALKEGRVNMEALAEVIEDYQDAVKGRPPIEQKKRAINDLMANLKKVIMGRDL